jgi:hypothetical protein
MEKIDKDNYKFAGVFTGPDGTSSEATGEMKRVQMTGK